MLKFIRNVMLVTLMVLVIAVAWLQSMDSPPGGRYEVNKVISK